jgi:hypothetical protein
VLTSLLLGWALTGGSRGSHDRPVPKRRGGGPAHARRGLSGRPTADGRVSLGKRVAAAPYRARPEELPLRRLARRRRVRGCPVRPHPHLRPVRGCRRCRTSRMCSPSSPAGGRPPGGRSSSRLGGPRRRARRRPRGVHRGPEGPPPPLLLRPLVPRPICRGLLLGLGSAPRPARRRTRSAPTPWQLRRPGGGVTGRRHPGQAGRLPLSERIQPL